MLGSNLLTILAFYITDILDLRFIKAQKSLPNCQATLGFLHQGRLSFFASKPSAETSRIKSVRARR
jgi:hypothetical protein